MTLILKIAMFVVLFVMGTAVAHAQSCPEGYQVIGGEGAYGCAPRPDNDNYYQQQQYAPQQYAPQRSELAPLIESFGAFAIDARMNVSASWFSPSAKSAEDSALDACRRGNGGVCRLITNGSYQYCAAGVCKMIATNGGYQGCAAVGADGAGRVFLGLGAHTVCNMLNGIIAVKVAMGTCRSQSKTGKCHMLSGVIDAGSNYIVHSTVDATNTKQMHLSKSELARLGG